MLAVEIPYQTPKKNYNGKKYEQTSELSKMYLRFCSIYKSMHIRVLNNNKRETKYDKKENIRSESSDMI